MIDTNVLVYSVVDSSPKHKEARDYLTLLAENNVELWGWFIFLMNLGNKSLLSRR